MPSPIDPAPQKKIDEATTALAEAEKELEALMKALESGQRADKRMIGDVLRDAFSKLSLAKATLDALRSPAS